MPRINNVVNHRFNGNRSAKRTKETLVTFAYKFNRAYDNFTIHGNHRTITRCILRFRRNLLARHVINCIPSPKTNGHTNKRRRRSVNRVSVSFQRKRKNVFYFIKRISNLEASRNCDAFRFPGICILKEKRNRHFVNRRNIRYVYVNVIYGAVFRLRSRIVVTAKRNYRISGNRKRSRYFHRISKRIFNLKRYGMYTGRKRYIGSGRKILTGSAYVGKRIAVHINLTRRIVKLNVIRNNRRERHAVTVDRRTFFQRNRFICRGIAYVGNCRKNSVVHSRAIVQRNIVNIESMYSGRHRLDVRTNERR